MDDLEVTKEYRPNPDKPHEGKLKFQFGAKGHEIPQLVAAALLNHPHDGATVYYRSRPLMLGVGLSPFEAFASNMHKLEGVLWHDRQVTQKYRVLFVIDHPWMYGL